MMRRWSVFGAALTLMLGFGGTAHAQALIVDIDRGAFTWSWTKGTGGDVAEFRMRCGTLVYVIADPRTIPVKTVVPQPGTYTCVLTAANEFGESAPTAGVSFRTGSPPTSPAALTIGVSP